MRICSPADLSLAASRSMIGLLALHCFKTSPLVSPFSISSIKIKTALVLTAVSTSFMRMFAMLVLNDSKLLGDFLCPWISAFTISFTRRCKSAWPIANVSEDPTNGFCSCLINSSMKSDSLAWPSIAGQKILTVANSLAKCSEHWLFSDILQVVLQFLFEECFQWFLHYFK